MKNVKIFLVSLMVLAPLFLNAQTQNIEFGLQVGAGFFLGNENPAAGYTRTNEFAWMPNSEDMPAFETFGGLVRYRFDYRWTIQAQAMRQRMRFCESFGNQKAWYYNSIWNVDLMAEFNILKYGFVENKNAKIYTITPYVALGLGTSLYNKTATYRWRNPGPEKQNTPFPAVRAKDLAGSFYIPFAAGVKLRMATNWQLKLACQYNLYLVNGNLDGNTAGTYPYKNGGGVSYDGYQAASTHNIAATVGIIYNLPSNGRGGVMVNY